MGCSVVHSEIGTIDGVRSRGFSSDLFGGEVDVDGAGYGPVRAGAVEGIPGGMVQTPAETAPWVTFYVAVDDVEESLARAAELYATQIMEEPVPDPGVGDLAMFGDRAGNMIGIFGRTPADRLRSPLTVQRPRDRPHVVRPFREEAFMHDEDDLAARVAPVREGGDEAS